MAITKVGADVSTSIAAAGNADLTLPSGLAENDIVVVVCSSDAVLFDASVGVQTSGYNTIAKPNTAAPGHHIAWKRMGSTPDTVVNVTADADLTWVAAQAWRGVDTTTAIDATATSNSAATGMPDPPSYTTVTADALRIIIGVMEDDFPPSVVAPAGYSNLLSVGTNLECAIMMASKIDAVADAEDPAIFTSGTPNTDNHFAYHFALRPSAGAASQDLTPSLFTDGDTFYAPTVTVGVVNLSPSLFTDGDTFFAPAVVSTYALVPGLFTDGDTFYAPAVTTGAVNLAPSLFANDNTFHVPTVAPGAADIAPALFTNENTFFSPTVSGVAGAQDLQPSLFANDNTFFSATVAAGAVDLAPGLFTDGDTFLAPTVASSYGLAPGLFTDGDTFFAPTVAVGAQGLAPSLHANDNTFYSPNVGFSGNFARSFGMITG